MLLRISHGLSLMRRVRRHIEILIVMSECWSRSLSLGASALVHNLSDASLTGHTWPMTNVSAATEPEVISEADKLEIIQAVFRRIGEITFKEIGDDIARLETLPPGEDVILRLKWQKKLDLMFEARKVYERRYGDDLGQLKLIEETYGDTLDLEPIIRGKDVQDRLARYQRLVSVEYGERVRERILRCNITSPIEQVFLLEWHFQRLEERYRIDLHPQHKVSCGEKDYRIDFVALNQTGLKLAIELDGHDFHEKTREQVAKDKQRQRALVADGFTVLRFSGSEIVRDVKACVDEVAGVIEKSMSI